MGNVTLPTPVFVAGGALCLVAGYLVGSVVGPGTPERTTATVVSFEAQRATLCLEGSGVEEQGGVDSSGKLCGTWRRTAGSQTPSKGDTFRFVAIRTTGQVDGKTEQQVVIYGDVAN